MSKLHQSVFPVLNEFAQDGELGIEWAHLLIHPEMLAEFDDNLNLIIKLLALIPDISKGDRVKLVGKLTIKQLQMKKKIMDLIKKDNTGSINDLYRIGSDMGYILRDVVDSTALLSKASVEYVESFKEFIESMSNKKDEIEDEFFGFQDVERHWHMMIAFALTTILFVEDDCKEECKFKKIFEEVRKKHELDLPESQLDAKQSVETEVI